MTAYNTKKLHIVHTEASLGWGGQEIRILTEAQGMVERGHRVTLLCPPEARIHAAAKERGLPVEALPIGRKKPGGVLALRRWLITNRSDVINTHSSTDTWLTALACLFLKRPPPVVRTRHVSAPIPNNRATRWLYGTATRHIVTTGEALRRQLIEENRFDPDRITSVPTGIDTRRFAPGDRAASRRSLDLPPAATVIGIVATLRSWKGHSFLLDAFAGLAREHCILVIVGDGPQRASLELQIANLNIGGRVRMAGNQPDVLPWLRAFDIFALPSYANEGVPQALVQAMLCGLPCITTNVGSIGEAAVNEQTALVVAPQDAGALRQALLRLIEAPKLREQLGVAAESRCRERFGFESMLDAMEAIFARVTASHGAENQRADARAT